MIIDRLTRAILRRLKAAGLVADVILHDAKWTIRKYANDADFAAGKPFEVSVVPENILLTEGITALQNLLTAQGGATAFSNAAAYLGVGDSATAASVGQTGLQAAANKLYKAMQATYPTIAGAVTTWRAVFGSAEANFAWNEFSVANGSSDAAVNLNRVVSAQGTKTAGQTWTLDLAITWS